jgi:hypothetical protein
MQTAKAHGWTTESPAPLPDYERGWADGVKFERQTSQSPASEGVMMDLDAIMGYVVDQGTYNYPGSPLLNAISNIRCALLARSQPTGESGELEEKIKDLRHEADVDKRGVDDENDAWCDGINYALYALYPLLARDPRVGDTASSALLDDEAHPRVEGWISVKERLPEDHGHVLVWRKRQHVYKAGWFATIGRGEWRNEDNGIVTPTHWMPLPEPPKEGV